jgi:hypothetical protein
MAAFFFYRESFHNCIIGSFAQKVRASLMEKHSFIRQHELFLDKKTSKTYTENAIHVKRYFRKNPAQANQKQKKIERMQE